MNDLPRNQIANLLLEALEHEIERVLVYESALACNTADYELRKEWEEHLSQTRSHLEMVYDVCGSLGIDPATETPGRKHVRRVGQVLLEAIRRAGASGDERTLEGVAAECVLIAETRDHRNWGRIGEFTRAGIREPDRDRVASS